MSYSTMRAFSDSISASSGSKASRNSGLEIFRNLSIHLFGAAFRKSCAVRLGQPSGCIHQRRARADQDRSRPDHRQMDLRLGTAMAHRTKQAGIDSGQTRERPGIQPIVFPAALADQLHVARMGHNHFVP